MEVCVRADGKWDPPANSAVGSSLLGPPRDASAGVPPVCVWRAAREADGARGDDSGEQRQGQVRVSSKEAANDDIRAALCRVQPLRSSRTGLLPPPPRYGKLEELLEKSFPLVKMPSIQPVVMQVLKHLPKVSEAVATPGEGQRQREKKKKKKRGFDSLRRHSEQPVFYSPEPTICHRLRCQRRSWSWWWPTRTCTRCVRWRWSVRSGRTTRRCSGTRCRRCSSSTSWRRRRRCSAATSPSSTTSSALPPKWDGKARWVLAFPPLRGFYLLSVSTE